MEVALALALHGEGAMDRAERNQIITGAVSFLPPYLFIFECRETVSRVDRVESERANSSHAW